MSVPSSHDSAVLDAIFNPLLPLGQEIPEQNEEETIQIQVEESDADQQAKEIEIKGVRCAEENDMERALNFFNEAVSVAPGRASCYNNRAQALRLRGDVEGALEDLNTAINLSQGHGKAACQAFTQRGLIHRLEGRDEEALADFRRAAGLGSQFARAQVVQLNPYAAMCNQMLAEVIGKLRRGEEDQE